MKDQESYNQCCSRRNLSLEPVLGYHMLVPKVDRYADAFVSCVHWDIGISIPAGSQIVLVFYCLIQPVFILTSPEFSENQQMKENSGLVEIIGF